MRKRALPPQHLLEIAKVSNSKVKLTLQVEIEIDFEQFYGSSPLRDFGIADTLKAFLLNQSANRIFDADIGAENVSAVSLEASPELEQAFEAYAKEFNRIRNASQTKAKQEAIAKLQAELKELSE